MVEGQERPHLLARAAYDYHANTADKTRVKPHSLPLSPPPSSQPHPSRLYSSLVRAIRSPPPAPPRLLPKRPPPTRRPIAHAVAATSDSWSSSPRGYRILACTYVWTWYTEVTGPTFRDMEIFPESDATTGALMHRPTTPYGPSSSGLSPLRCAEKREGSRIRTENKIQQERWK
ncbi:hypothetical protein ALC60_00673 [Trachymyrmex zeteki]|uniref:Uncharacterized protein n=1 Tax=Mycetomoellerius zeteki TaxID=64791 RepID=A0A151XIX3_9HYME|nr:hypothetical protein ALC60_00673 [Trachymyrmex zeteki]